MVTSNNHRISHTPHLKFGSVAFNCAFGTVDMEITYIEEISIKSLFSTSSLFESRF